jgi:radical SAM superfamily enzyme YgiQ (UPF0313 family)
VIVLSTLNARYAHASFGLRYLLANMGDLRPMTRLLELETGTPRLEVVEKVLALTPRIVGFGVYIWNVVETTAVISDLKALRPDIIVVVGGPEVSYELEGQEIVRLADHVVTGEADLAFPALARELLQGAKPEKVIEAPLPDLARVALPYDDYTDEDLAHRVTYVEASRGCPYRCEFCLSSLDVPVRSFALEPFLGALERLLARGARRFKFVDRTFNLSPATSGAILRFFQGRLVPGLHLHFELVPDRFPQELRALAARFPAGTVQFEIGVQTFTEEVNRSVSRFQDNERTCENLRFLRDETQVHVHADLIFGLPGETLETFGASFDQLLPLVPGDVQLGILKRLRGTPIVRHETAGTLVFSPIPPYEVLSTSTASFDETNRMKRFARYFEVFRNGDDHPRALERLLGDAPFQSFLEFTDWLYARVGRTNKLALVERCELLFDFLVKLKRQAPQEVASTIVEDFYGDGIRSERLPFLEEHVDRESLIRRQRENRARAHASAQRPPGGRGSDGGDHDGTRRVLVDGSQVITTTEGRHRLTHERKGRDGERNDQVVPQ